MNEQTETAVTTEAPVNAPTTGTSETPEQKRKRLLAARAAREAAAAQADADQELRVLELEDLFSVTGKRSFDFEILEHGGNILVVRRGSGLLFKSFTGSKMTEKDTIDFVKECALHPSKDEVQTLLEEFPALANRAALTLAELYGAKRSVDAGK
jgi:hypothetical protein